MKKEKSISVLRKPMESGSKSKTPSNKLSTSKLNLSTNIKKSSTPSYTKKPPVFTQTSTRLKKSFKSLPLQKRPKENEESNYLLNTLKTYIMKTSRELNLIQKEIPKFTARKIQDLKKGYKFNEDFDSLSSCFFTLFVEIDEDLKKDMISLRMKIGEYFISYFSNSGKFIKLLKNLTEVIKKIDLSPKVLTDSMKFLESVKREKLSTNYQDLFDFLKIILDYFKSKKSGKALGEVDQSFNKLSGTQRFATPDKLLSSQNLTNKSVEMSFLEFTKPLSCSNKSVSCMNLFKKPPISKSPLTRSAKENRMNLQKTLKKTSNRLDESKLSENEMSSVASREQVSIEKKKEWEEIRDVRNI